jgi:hypothetical protein
LVLILLLPTPNTLTTAPTMPMPMPMVLGFLRLLRMSYDFEGPFLTQTLSSLVSPGDNKICKDHRGKKMPTYQFLEKNKRILCPLNNVWVIINY